MSAGAFNSRSGTGFKFKRVVLVWASKHQHQAASGTFPRWTWTLHCGAVSALCELDLSMAPVSRNATRHLYLATFAPDIFINLSQRRQHSLHPT
jgi:hypothetical protein